MRLLSIHVVESICNNRQGEPLNIDLRPTNPVFGRFAKTSVECLTGTPLIVSLALNSEAWYLGPDKADLSVRMIWIVFAIEDFMHNRYCTLLPPRFVFTLLPHSIDHQSLHHKPCLQQSGLHLTRRASTASERKIKMFRLQHLEIAPCSLPLFCKELLGIAMGAYIF